MIKTWIYPLFIMVSLYALNVSCSKDDDNLQKSEVYTTLDRMVVPVAVPTGNAVAIDDPANFGKNGFGLWEYGLGLPYNERLDLMSPAYNNNNVMKSANLLRFFTISDIHITDKESPAQAIYFKDDIHLGKNSISLYTPLMLYTTQVFDATIQTINKLNKQNPIDFGLVLGDMANSSQYNEIRWFIDIVDGKNINPDSGDRKTTLYQDQTTIIRMSF